MPLPIFSHQKGDILGAICHHLLSKPRCAAFRTQQHGGLVKKREIHPSFSHIFCNFVIELLSCCHEKTIPHSHHPRLRPTALAQATQPCIVKQYNQKQTKTPLSGVQVEVRDAGSAVSASNGAVTLRFATLKPGTGSRRDASQQTGRNIMRYWRWPWKTMRSWNEKTPNTKR